MVSTKFAALTASLAFCVLPQVAQSADYPDQNWPDDMRGSYNWTDAAPDSVLGFEVGLRYFYSVGQHRMTLSSGDSYSEDDKSHILEAHVRIDDHSTDTYFKARAGYSLVVDTEYATPATGGATVSATGGHIAYAGADLGYLPFGVPEARFGAVVGYNFMNEAPFMGRRSYALATGGDSDVNDVNIHALKLGLAARSELGPFTIDAEAAAIPYAWLTGTYGSFSVANFSDGTTNYQQGSAGAIDGSLYGASGEVMLGYKATENLSINFGGRASYLTGKANMHFTAREVGNTTNAQDYLISTTNLSFLRYGLLAGISGKF